MHVPDEVLGYTLGEALGSGAMGKVFRARRPGGGPERAIKLVPMASLWPQEVQRLEREMGFTRGLSHRNLLTVYDAGVVEGYFAIVMDLLDGGTAESFINAPPDWVTVVRVLRMTALGLEHAWRVGHLIHRDIKPANILLNRDRGRVVRAVVGDFGLARESGAAEGLTLTRTGVIMGTPWYIAPEQARGDRDLDHRVDQYALGATLYHLLCGVPPFQGRTATECILAHLQEPPPRLRPRQPGVPPALGTIIATCLAKDRDRRFPDHAAVVRALSAVLDGAGQREITDIIQRPFAMPSSPATARWTRPRLGAPTPATEIPALPAIPAPAPIVITAEDQQAPEEPQDPAITHPVVVQPYSLADGTAIDRYHRIEAPLGRGGMGEVYRVHDHFLGRRLAMKILPVGADAQTVERFRAEANAIASVTHPAFPSFAGNGVFEDRDYLYMEIIAGLDLREVLRRDGALPEAQVVPMAIAVADALEDGFRRCGLVHRDIKPHNLILSDDPRTPIRVVDLGLAAYFAAPDPDDFTGKPLAYLDDGHGGRSVGTPAYMSPEQCRGEAPTPSMDIYAIGATLFHLLTNRTVYEGGGAMAIIARQMSSPVPEVPAEAPVSSGLRDIIHRCLQKSPADRYATHADLAAALRALG